MKIKSTFLFISMLSASVAAKAQTNYVQNPSFEDSPVGGTVTMWTEEGNTDASKIEGTANWTPDGSRHMTHWLGTAYITDTYQTITVPNGVYKLTALVASDAKFNSRKMYAKDFGGTEVSVALPAYANWTEVQVANINVTNGQIRIGFYHDGNANSWMSADKVSLIQTSALPVSLLSFNADQNPSGVNLNWKTASETNNSHFVVERSIDGSNFNQLTTIKGKNNSSVLSAYSFIDKYPVSGADNYYRLTQVDLDGTQTVLGVRSVKGLSVAGYSLYPNPASDKVTIGIPDAKADDYTIRITDFSGKVFLSGKKKSEGGLIQLSLADFSSGIYLLTVSGKTLNQSSSLIIQK